MSDELEEITPHESVVPVFVDPTPLPLDDLPDLAAIMAAEAAAREAREIERAAGIAKLVALGLTEAEAAAIANPQT